MRRAKLAVDRDEARRGEELRVTLTLPRTVGERVEVGLVCTERCDYAARAQTKAGRVVIRQTREITAHERWHPVEATGESTYTFDIPRNAPYSYEGECVSFAWRVSARAVRAMRSDPRTDHAIWVLP